MKKYQLFALTLAIASPFLLSFCGIYVSKYENSVKNKTSQVIIVRDGDRNVVTMYNDFKGDTKDFAMVVPVPVVLKEKDIKVVNQSIFNKLNEYSAPRLVEYYDENPCEPQYKFSHDMALASAVSENKEELRSKSITRKLNVKIEAQYIVGEYDILILSAQESSGLKTWLTINGYKIPDGAEEVLEPYIKSNLKFFVAKVNQKKQHQTGGQFLRPIQISFTSPKFMLPIRLGMANGDGDQDLVVYCFTKTGRVECVNYRNVKMPTGNNIPMFVRSDFSNFYDKTFTRKWKTEGKNVGILEYAWNVSPVNNMKCDPCVGPPPVDQDFVQAGIWWLEGRNADQRAFFTRMHFRYNRQSFPQDLVFQVTPNFENYQARYVLTHPATGNFNCDAGKRYLEEVKQRRKKELRELVSLTGNTVSQYLEETGIGMHLEDGHESPDVNYASLIPAVTKEMESEKNGSTPMAFIALALVGAAGLLRWKGLI